jgi:hypothetical protein
MKTLIGLMIALFLGSHSDTDLSGKWNMSVTGHMNLTATLEIKQEGQHITANFVIPDHGDLDMVGTFSNGRLTLNTTENAFAQMTLTGTFGENGSMSGTVQSQMGEMTWTATRASGK